MNNEQQTYILGQLDIMAEEIDAITDVAKRAEVRGKYIELFIDLCTVASVEGGIPEVVDEEIEEVIEGTEEIVEEPEEVYAETEAVVGEPEQESKVFNSEDVFEDIEEVRIVINDDEEEVDITEIFNKLRADGVDEEQADAIGLFLTEYECMEGYETTYSYMAHGNPRLYAAYMSSVLDDEQLLAYIIDFSGLEIGALEKPTDFINDENAEALYDFVFPSEQ